MTVYFLIPPLTSWENDTIIVFNIYLMIYIIKYLIERTTDMAPKNKSLAMENTFLKCISEFVQKAGYVLAICAGFALLAKAGALDGFKATSNKKALEWVMSVSNQVDWIRLEYKSVGSFGGYLNE